MRLALTLLCSLAALPAAGEFSLAFPVDCILDETCHIQQFVDHDPGPNATDFMCGTLTYDGHKGTDFALPSLAAQAAGVAVLAAAPGRVVGVRDGMPDILQTGPDAPDVRERECGNGVVIRHDDGWETQYCHMAEGSLTVVPDQDVQAGDTLGMIGLSGQTQFPHLHVSVRRNGEVVDPFAPDSTGTCGTVPARSLWAQTPDIAIGGLISIGFAADVPEFDAIKAGHAHRDTLARTDALVIWGNAFGSRAGDRLDLAITGPTGEVIRETVMLDRPQAQVFRAIGKRAPQGGWDSGVYEGNVQHVRDGAVIDQQSIRTTIR